MVYSNLNLFSDSELLYGGKEQGMRRAGKSLETRNVIKGILEIMETNILFSHRARHFIYSSIMNFGVNDHFIY
jgi:hypothetical protein